MDISEKRFRDPVHGYISIPEDICRDFIDTQVFQRLRHIEQTSMRVLYPSARHDRFIHSLGTYHLGKRLFEYLHKNADDETKSRLARHKKTFHIACLMHDCGHAPFSHTCERFYNYNRKTGSASEKPVYRRLKEVYAGASDFEADDSFNPKEHEAFSAIILKVCYGDALNRCECDVELAARMITGCTYPDETEPDNQIKNILIGLLNGSAIDVDKLDYILRDTWASGVQNTSVDIDRLLAAARIHRGDNDRLTLCFHKSALSVLQTVLNARNYLYEWIYGDHTILYYAELLDRAVCKLAGKLSPSNPNDFWETVFSETPFLRPQRLGEASFYLPNDGDLWFWLKHFKDDIEEVQEYLERMPRRLPLWKTMAEFRSLFPHLKNPKACDSVGKRIPHLFAERFDTDENNIIVTSGLFNPARFDEDGISILLKDADFPISLTSVMGDPAPISPKHFFYVFVPRYLKDKKNEMIELIKNQKR